ncbi:MAG: hypothetical protein K0R55_3978 [Sporomusa sp.]|nr:hypothetical protein [Sporomusa sp.]
MKKIFLIMTCLMIAFSGISDAATKLILDKDTKLIPVGCKVGRLITFKGGAEVVFNDQGEVTEGTLAGTESFFPAGIGYRVVSNEYTRIDLQPAGIPFQGRIVFNEKGEVVSGKLGVQKVYFALDNAGKYLELLWGKNVSFHPNGTVAEGTLTDDMLLRPIGWRNIKNETAGFIRFKGNSEIKLNPESEVLSGTLVEETKIGDKFYPAGTKLTFSE